MMKLKQGSLRLLEDQLQYIQLLYKTVTIPADNRHPQGYGGVKWNHTEILDLRRFKEAIISYGIHSLYVINNSFLLPKIIFP